MQLRITDRTQQVLSVALIAGLLVACGDDDSGTPNRNDGGAGTGGNMQPMDSGTPSGGLGANVAGKACSTNADCGSGTCAMQIPAGGALPMLLSAPGGYCTAPCSSDAQCGEGGACLDDLGDLDLADSQCYGRCATTDDCREGYVCSADISLTGGGTMVNNCRPAPATDQLDDGVVGDECTAAEDCPGGTCLTATPGIIGGVGSMPLPGGYCSGRCLDATHCGEGGVCQRFPIVSGPGTCYLGCASDDDCDRDGYRCRDLGTGMRGCSPAADPLPNDTVGDACSADADCGGNAGSCATELPGSGIAGVLNPVAAPGGYCSQACMEASDCGEGGVCVTGTCYRACMDMGDCRDGYFCDMRGGTFGTAVSMVCAPGTAPDDPDAG